MFYWLYISLALLGALIASYFDVKSRIIPKELTLGLLGISLALHFLESGVKGDVTPFFDSVISAVVSFVVLYVIWRLGFIAGGDVKLLVAINTLLPVTRTFDFIQMYHLQFLPVLWNGILVSTPALVFYLLIKLNRKLLGLVKDSLISSLGYSFLIFTIITHYSGWQSLALIFVLSFVPYKPVVFLVPWLFSVYPGRLTMWIYTFLVIFALDLFFKIMFTGKDKFVIKKQLSELSEGDIVVGYYVGRKLVRVRPRSSGVSLSDISNFKSMGATSVLVQKAVPFTPIILLGVLVLVSIGDLLWLVVR